MHRWDTDPQKFKEIVEAKSKVKVVLLNEGEEFQILSQLAAACFPNCPRSSVEPLAKPISAKQSRKK
jgi:hypothetical protein